MFAKITAGVLLIGMLALTGCVVAPARSHHPGRHHPRPVVVKPIAPPVVVVRPWRPLVVRP